jgi:SAM-dependent methyltransferase
MTAFDSRVKQILRHHPAPGSIMDVGMGDGAFLAAMKQLGWNVAGVDVEPSVIAYAQSCLGIGNCRRADVEKDPLPAGPYDVITLWGVFQLAYHPHNLLARLREMLVPGGVLAMGLSNIDSAGAGIFRSRWYGWGLPRHLVHFSPETLKNLLDRSGYTMLEMTFDTPGWIVNSSVNATLRLPWPLDKACRFASRTAFGLIGHSRWGDTFSVTARAELV